MYFTHAFSTHYTCVVVVINYIMINDCSKSQLPNNFHIISMWEAVFNVLISGIHLPIIRPNHTFIWSDLLTFIFLFKAYTSSTIIRAKHRVWPKYINDFSLNASYQCLMHVWDYRIQISEFPAWRQGRVG